MAFEGGRLIVAARAQRSGWRAIVSAHVTVLVDGDDLVIRLVKTAVGALGARPAASGPASNQAKRPGSQVVSARPGLEAAADSSPRRH